MIQDVPNCFRIKKCAFFIALLSTAVPAYAATNSFADVPLHLQSNTTTTSSYSVKPNVTLFIDDSASMTEKIKPDTYKCKKKVAVSDNKGRLTWQNTNIWVNGFISKPETKSKPTSPSDVTYDGCVKMNKLDSVQEVLTDVVTKYHKNIYFSLQPLNLESWYNSKRERPKYDQFYGVTEKQKFQTEQERQEEEASQLQTLLDLINGNQKTGDAKIRGLHAHGGTPTSRRFVAVARNIVMNKLRYRCQKSYVVLLSDGIEQQGGYRSIAIDSPLWSKFKYPSATSSHKNDYKQLDGYFNDFNYSTGTYNDYSGACQTGFWQLYLSPPKDKEPRAHRLSYYTHTLATKSFGAPSIQPKNIGQKKPYNRCTPGLDYANTYNLMDGSTPDTPYRPYIYDSDYVKLNGTKVLIVKEDPKHPENKNSQPRTTDEGGKPWNDWIDPNDHSKGRFKQLASTFTIGFGIKGLVEKPDPEYPEDPEDPDNEDSETEITATSKAAATNKQPTPDEQAATDSLLNAATTANAEANQMDGKYKDAQGNVYGKLISPSKKNFFLAESREEIIDKFKQIFDSIIGEIDEVQKPITTTTPNLSAATTTTGNLVVRSTIDTATWSSMLQISKGDGQNSTTVLNPTFNNGNRRFILSDGNHHYSYPNDLGNLDNSYFGINNDAKPNEWKDGLLTWLARAKSDNQIKQDGFDYRQRTTTSAGINAHDMGDIVDNSIVTAQPMVNYWPKFLVTSTNEGLVYVFKATGNDSSPYTLSFNYMPLGMQRNSLDNSDTVNKYYKDLTQKNYGQNSKTPHRYLLNGGITVVSTDRSEHPFTYMASTMGQAGRGVFALNIGGQDLATNEKVGADDTSANWYQHLTLFHSSKGEGNQFGYTVGAPAISYIRVDKTAPTGTHSTSARTNIRHAVIVGSGFNYPYIDPANVSADSTETALYIYDALGLDVGIDHKPALKTGDAKGTLIKKIVVPNGVGGLGSPFTISSNNNGVSDVVYAGDYGGNMYRFDLRADNPNEWTVQKIFAASSNDHSPITSAPFVYQYQNGEYIVVFGTGSEIYSSDLDSKDQQYMYGIYDNLSTNRTPVSRANLMAQKIISLENNTRSITDNQFSSTNNRTGWYFELPDAGERVVQSPDLKYHTILFNTHSFSVKKVEIEDPCVQTTSSTDSQVFTYHLQVNVFNGGQLKKNDFHLIWDKNHPFLMGMGSFGNNNLVYFNESDNSIGGGSGVMPELHDGPQKLPKQCLDSNVNIDSSGNTKPEGGATGGLCSVVLRRLSWHEVLEGYNTNS